MCDVTMKDILGEEVKVNSWIAVSFREGTNSSLRIGKVIGFGRRKLYNNEILTMAVQWYITSGILMPAKPSSIDSKNCKFVIIPPPKNLWRTKWA
jgi:hypothetical protein